MICSKDTDLTVQSAELLNETDINRSNVSRREQLLRCSWFENASVFQEYFSSPGENEDEEQYGMDYKVCVAFFSVFVNMTVRCV